MATHLSVPQESGIILAVLRGKMGSCQYCVTCLSNILYISICIDMYNDMICIMVTNHTFYQAFFSCFQLPVSDTDVTKGNSELCKIKSVQPDRIYGL